MCAMYSAHHIGSHCVNPVQRVSTCRACARDHFGCAVIRIDLSRRFTHPCAMFQGHPELVIPCIQTKLLPMLLANYAIWPLAHLINFKYVPSQQRILYINCVQVWKLSPALPPRLCTAYSICSPAQTNQQIVHSLPCWNLTHTFDNLGRVEPGPGPHVCELQPCGAPEPHHPL
jgi:hypothetical protein